MDTREDILSGVRKNQPMHPDLERFVAKRMKATTHEFDSSHVPMVSNPKLVIDVIRLTSRWLQFRMLLDR
jgi:hypothetical protein